MGRVQKPQSQKLSVKFLAMDGWTLNNGCWMVEFCKSVGICCELYFTSKLQNLWLWLVRPLRENIVWEYFQAFSNIFELFGIFLSFLEYVWALWSFQDVGAFGILDYAERKFRWLGLQAIRQRRWEWVKRLTLLLFASCLLQALRAAHRPHQAWSQPRANGPLVSGLRGPRACTHLRRSQRGHLEHLIWSQQGHLKSLMGLLESTQYPYFQFDRAYEIT